MRKSIFSSLTGIFLPFAFWGQSLIITTIGGNGSAGYSGDNGPATSAALNFPVKVASDANGNIYFADNGNNVIRRIDAVTNIVTTVAGTGSAGYTGDNGPATSATLNGPWGVAVDANENIYFTDAGNNVIRRVDGSTHIITTIAGNGSVGYSGDNGPALSATFNGMTSLALDAGGNIYVTDDNNNVVRRINGSTQIVTTIAGNGTQGFSGDNGPAVNATLNFPVGISVKNGVIYLTDSDNHRIRKITSDGIISTIAGNGSPGYNGDGIPATSANLYNPWDAVADDAGNIYIADFFNCRIRRVDVNTGLIATYAGGICGYSGDGGLATDAAMSAPTGLCFDNNGHLIIVDTYNNVIRKVGPAPTPINNICSNSINIGTLADESKSSTNIKQKALEGWYSFTATTKSILINVQNNLESIRKIKSISFYKGTCGSLDLLSVDSISSDSDHLLGAYYGALNEGQTYYVLLRKDSLGDTASFKFSYQTASVEARYCLIWGGPDISGTGQPIITTNPCPDYSSHEFWYTIDADPSISNLPNGDKFTFMRSIGADPTGTAGDVDNSTTSTVPNPPYDDNIQSASCGDLNFYINSSLPNTDASPRQFTFHVKLYMDGTMLDNYDIIVNVLVPPTIQTQQTIVCLNQNQVMVCLTDPNYGFLSGPVQTFYLYNQSNPGIHYPLPTTGGGGVYCASVPITPNAQNNINAFYEYGFDVNHSCFETFGTTTTQVNPKGLDLTLSSDHVNACVGQATTITVASSFGNIVTYNWSPATGLNTTAGNQVVFTPTSTGTYVFTVNGFDSQTGCSDSKSITINVFVPPSVPQIDALTTPPQSNVTGAYQCNFIAGQQTFSTSSSGGHTYLWSISPSGSGAYFWDGHTASNTYNGPTAVLDVHAATMDIQLCLTAIDPLTGCANSTCIPVKQCCPAPAGFTAIGGNFSGGAGLSTSQNNKKYFVTGVLYLSGGLTISNSEFIMNPGSSIVAGSNVTINNSHFYACSDMWRGIGFDGPAAGKTLSISGSLIEDAEYAIDVAGPPLTQYQALNPNVTLSKVWFNRCAVGACIDFDPLTTITSASIFSGNFQINNCVFTCRNNVTMAMVQSNATPQGNTSALTSLPVFPQATLHNYKNNNNYYSFTGVAAGLIANNGGSGIARTIKNSFFDEQVDGILSGGDLTVQKCNFQYMLKIAGSANEAFINNGNYGQLVFANSLKSGSGVNFYGSGLTIGGNPANACSFNLCNYGVIAEPDGGSAISITNNTFNLTFYSGVYLTSIGATAAYNVSSNTFSNHFYQGINAFFVPNPQSSGGKLTIQSNTFSIANAFYSSFNPTYTNLPEAVYVASQPVFSSLPVNNAKISVNGNTITNYQLGIRAESAPVSNVNNNTITMYEDNVITTNPNDYTHGISVTNSKGSTIRGNDIGSINTVPAWKTSQYGIFSASNNNAVISCNNVHGPDVALKCQGPQNISSIAENTLQNAAFSSLWLDGTIVGPQGHGGFPGFSNANKFVSVGQYAAYANNGSNGNLSPFYYINSGVNRPIPSFGDAGTGGTAIPTGGVYALTPFATTPLPCPTSGIMLNQPPILANGVAQQIANNLLTAAQFTTTANFGNRLDLFRILVGSGSAAYNSDPTLLAFMNSQNGTTQARLTASDTLLANAGTDTGKVNAALAINNSFTPVDNYDTKLQKINNLYGAFAKQRKRLSTVQVQEVRAIAQLCPFEYGEGVYRARALLSRFDTLCYWNPCEQTNSITSGARVAAQPDDAQRLVADPNIVLYPNPASGSLFVQGLQIQETDKAELYLYDELGELALHQQLSSVSSVNNINIDNLKSGTYLCKVYVNGVPHHIDKVIVLK